MKSPRTGCRTSRGSAAQNSIPERITLPLLRKLSDEDLSNLVTQVLNEKADLRTFHRAMLQLTFLWNVLSEYRQRHRWVKELPA